MNNTVPKSPWNNPPLDEGIYDAIVKEIKQRTYGAEYHPMLRIVFELTDEEYYLVTNMYFPEGNSIHSEQRLWHFCRSVGLEKHDVVDQPEAFEGRKLRLHIKSLTSADYAPDHTYSDVEGFHPAEAEEDQPDLLHMMG